MTHDITPNGFRCRSCIVWMAVLALASACGRSEGPSGPAGVSELAWVLAPGTTWQVQFTGTLDTSLDVKMYDVDLFDTPTETIDTLLAQGRVVICYLSAGTYEKWRPDAPLYPPEALGRRVDGWAGERWVDIRNATVRDILRARLDLAVQKHCSGVDPDNVDGYSNRTGFPLKWDDQLSFNRWIAGEAHSRGLSVGLKNDVEQVGQLAGDFDWAFDEECVVYNECDQLMPFIQAGKAVFHVEYGGDLNQICAITRPLGFSTLKKDLELSAIYQPCP
jgi:hypothetical protein